MSPSVQGSAGSRGSLLAPHAAKQVAALLTRSAVPPAPSFLWTWRLLYVCTTEDPAIGKTALLPLRQAFTPACDAF